VNAKGRMQNAKIEMDGGLHAVILQFAIYILHFEFSP
jgi:hypothetical protein